IRDRNVTGVQTCALPICDPPTAALALGLRLAAERQSSGALPRQPPVATLRSVGEPSRTARLVGTRLLDGTVALPDQSAGVLGQQIGRASCRERVEVWVVG